MLLCVIRILLGSSSFSTRSCTNAIASDFCATDTYSWKQLANEIGQRLHARGVIPTAEARALLPNEEEEVLGAWSGFAYGSNCE
jgi:hypothetical protein